MSNTSDAANVWHAAAPRIDVQVVSDLGGNDCDGRVRLEAARTPGAVGGADPGEIRIDPREDWVQYRTSFIAHELGHHFLGAAYDGRDPYHPPSGPSLMVINASSLTVTADDVSRLP